jgi:hypothetical protein
MDGCRHSNKPLHQSFVCPYVYINERNLHNNAHIYLLYITNYYVSMHGTLQQYTRAGVVVVNIKLDFDPIGLPIFYSSNVLYYDTALYNIYIIYYVAV